MIQAKLFVYKSTVYCYTRLCNISNEGPFLTALVQNRTIRQTHMHALNILLHKTSISQWSSYCQLGTLKTPSQSPTQMYAAYISSPSQPHPSSSWSDLGNKNEAIDKYIIIVFSFAVHAIFPTHLPAGLICGIGMRQ